MPDAAQKAPSIEVTAKDLPLHCPMPRTPLWAYHPRVFLQFPTYAPTTTASGEIVLPIAKCAYCGTEYLYAGKPPKEH